MDSQSGQAAVEWVGLLLLMSLGLAGLLALASRVEGRSLGGALAHAITCTAGGRCVEPARAGPAPHGPAFGLAAGRVVPRARSLGSLPRPVVPRARPRPSLPRPPLAPDRAAAAFQALRGVKRIAGRAWIVCLGYKRFQYERAHPEVTITGRMPVREALRIANACLNPAEFLGEEG